MGNISSNSIFHFTADKESLKGILTENFKIKYCKERMPFKEEDLSIYVPMVSFCEIPLSQVKDHLSKYGDYGIGLDREWAVKNGLNPVLYIEPNSSLAASYHSALRHYFKAPETLKKHEKRALMDVGEFMRFMKPYQGSLLRRGESVESYRFSDEREWRYVPPIDSENVALYADIDILTDDDYFVANASVAHMRLHFDPNDIKYIILREDSEIHEFVRHLNDVKGANYFQRDVERLTTRIITAKQIREDF